MNIQIRQTLEKEIQTKFDGLQSTLTGMGTSLDKLTYTKPTFNDYSEYELLNIYLGIPQIGTVIDLIAEDLYKEGYEICSENKEFETVINAEHKRLKAKERLVELKKFERIYSNGGLLYFLVDVDNNKYPIQNGGELSNELPQIIRQFNQINSVPSYLYTVSVNNGQPTQMKYNDVMLNMDGARIHESRYIWSVNNFQPLYGIGMSEVEKLAMIGNGLFIAAWAMVNMIYEAQLKVYKSNALQKEGSWAKIKETLKTIRKSLDSQSAMVIGETESFTKENFTIQGFKEVKDYLIEFFCSIANIPIEIFLGQSKGVISIANNPQSLNYYSSLVKKQKLEEEPKVRRITDIILRQEGLIKYQGVPYEIKWNDIFSIDESTKADIRLKTAQADLIEIDKGIQSPQQIAKMRYPQDDYDYATSEHANFESNTEVNNE